MPSIARVLESARERNSGWLVSSGGSPRRESRHWVRQSPKILDLHDDLISCLKINRRLLGLSDDLGCAGEDKSSWMERDPTADELDQLANRKYHLARI